MALISLIDKDRKPGPFPVGRRCAHPECITILHTRHEGDYCYQHEDDQADLDLALAEWTKDAA